MKRYDDKERDKQCLALFLEQDAILGKIWVQLEKERRCRSAENCLIAANPYKSTVKHPVGELPGVSRGV